MMAVHERETRHGERGQSTVLAITMLSLLLLFVGVSVNIGQAVNRRVAAQLIADAGAFTGATNMAIGANGVAYWNGLIQDSWAALTWATGGFIIAPDCAINDQAVRAYQQVRRMLGLTLQTVNLGYTRLPFQEARRVSRYNEYDLFPSEVGQLQYLEWDPAPDARIQARRNTMPLPPDNGVFSLTQVSNGTRPRSDIPALSGARRSAFWICYCSTCPPPLQWQPRSASFDVWYRKADPSPNYFSFIVKIPRTSALLFDRFLGGDAIPEMKAAAAAKPVGGSIERRESKYISKMVPLRNVMGGLLSGLLPTGPPAIVFTDGLGGTTTKRVTH